MTTFLCMLPMAIWGGSAVHNFAVPMLFGIFIATRRRSSSPLRSCFCSATGGSTARKPIRQLKIAPQRRKACRARPKLCPAPTYIIEKPEGKAPGMPHDTPLIATPVIGLCLAFIFGAIATRLKISPSAIFWPVSLLARTRPDSSLIRSDLQLAEIGVILLMFGVGLHFPQRSLSVKAIAVPGALAQIAAAALGTGLGLALGWDAGRSGFWPRTFDRQYRRPVARHARAPPDRHRTWTHRSRLADRRRPWAPWSWHWCCFRQSPV